MTQKTHDTGTGDDAIPTAGASIRAAAPILLGAALMLSLAMGLRQSLGLFVQPAIKDLSILVADFTIAIAIQNIAWGVLQPVAGGVAARFGFRLVLLAGAALFALGMLVLGAAHSLFGVVLGAGVFIGAALACCGSGMAMAVASRPVPAAVRSTVLGMVSAVGSLGALLTARSAKLSPKHGAGAPGCSALSPSHC